MLSSDPATTNVGYCEVIMKNMFIAAACVAMTIALLLPLFAVSAQESSYLRGDADGDGKITISDVTKIQRILADLEPDTGGDVAMRADLDGSGLGISDATQIQRWLAEYENTYLIGQTVVVTQATVATTRNYDLPFIPKK